MSLIGWWSLNGDTLDRSPYKNHGEIVGDVTWTNGVITENSAQFVYSIESRVSIPHNSFLSSEIFGTATVFSFSFWGYFTQYTNYGHIIAKQTGANWSHTTAGVWISSSGVNFLIGCNEAGNLSGSYTTVRYSPSLNEWHHFSCVADGTNLKLYVDGVNRGTSSISTVTRERSENTADIQFGDYATSTTNGLYGRISDMRFYDHALSQNEIDTLMSGEYLPLNISQELSQQKIAHYKLDRDVYDCSGQNNHGQNNNAININDNKIGAGGYSFDDLNTFITTPDFSFSSTDDFTVSYWFKTNRATNYSVFHNGTSYGVARIRHTSANTISPEPSIVNISLSESFSTSVWEHFSFVRKSGIAYVYRNGNLVGQNTWSGNPLFNKIGGKPDNSSWSGYDGDIDDFRVYNISLSDQDILDIYKQRAKVDEFGNFSAHSIIETSHTPLLLDYTVWEEGSGSITPFSANGSSTENYRIIGTDPWGKETIIWEARPDDVWGADGGWNQYPYIDIDNSCMYRFSVWVNRYVKGTEGQFYLGLSGFALLSENNGVYSRITGSNSTNPYFNSFGNSLMAEDTWIFVVGHVWPAGSGTGIRHVDSGLYYIDGKYSSTGTDWIWREETIQTRHRSYLYYCTDTTVRQHFCYPRIDICDGTEPSINELLSGFDSNNIDYVRAKGGTAYISLDVGDKETITGNLIETATIDGIAGWWNFEDEATDISGNKKHGVIYGATPIIGFNNTTAYSFDGSSNYIKIDDNIVENPIELTISSWFKKTGAGSNYNCVVHKSSNSTIGSSEYWMGISATGYLTATIGARTGVGWAAGETAVECEDNRWYHLLASWDGDIVKVYIDGEYIKQYNLTTYSYLSTYPTRFGASTDGTTYLFAGVIEDVRIYDRSLNEQEVKLLYDLTSNGMNKIKQSSNKIYTKGIFKEI